MPLTSGSPPTEPITLRTSAASVEIIPALGAGLARFDVETSNGTRPVLRAMPPGNTDVLAMACNLLVPFSNRIAAGQFCFERRRYAMAPNKPALDPNPLHGDGWLKSWCLVDHDRTAAQLVLDDGAIGPWRYRAVVTWRLHDGDLRGCLTVTNTGPRLPFGGGFHPWFPRLSGTQLHFTADHVWLADKGRLPVRSVPTDSIPEWNFFAPRALPDDLMDNCFSGWTGQARIIQPELGIAVSVSASPPLAHAMVFSPGAQANFFCFEPVSHGIDAINQTGAPGMVVLDDGDMMQLEVSIGWSHH